MKNKSYQTNLTSFYEISRSIKVIMFDVIYTELHKANDLVLYGIWIEKIECNKVKRINGFQLVSELARLEMQLQVSMCHHRCISTVDIGIWH